MMPEIDLDVLKAETAQWKSSWSPRGGELLEWAIGTIERRAATYQKPEEGWVCFHCGERFIDYFVAKEHFGEGPDSLRSQIKRLKALLCEADERIMDVRYPYSTRYRVLEPRFDSSPWLVVDTVSEPPNNFVASFWPGKEILAMQRTPEQIEATIDALVQAATAETADLAWAAKQQAVKAWNETPGSKSA
jgi:hypothetical protein